METELSYGRFIERSLGGYIGSDGGVIERALGHYIGSDGGDDDGLYDCMFGICMQIWSEITSGGGGGQGSLLRQAIPIHFTRIEECSYQPYSTTGLTPRDP